MELGLRALCLSFVSRSAIRCPIVYLFWLRIINYVDGPLFALGHPLLEDGVERLFPGCVFNGVGQHYTYDRRPCFFLSLLWRKFEPFSSGSPGRLVRTFFMYSRHNSLIRVDLFHEDFVTHLIFPVCCHPLLFSLLSPWKCIHLPHVSSPPPSHNNARNSILGDRVLHGHGHMCSAA